MASSEYTFENVAKITALRITKRLCNFLNRPILQEQPLSLLDPYLGNIMTKCHPRHFLEQAGKIAGAQVNRLRASTKADVLIQIGFYILYGFLNDFYGRGAL